MLRRNAFFIFIGIILAISIVGCGGSPSHPVISGTLPNGTVGTPYTGTLTVTNGTAPFTWSITGLPATLTFPPAGSGNTVTISGTPLVAATITGTATVTDSKGHSSAAFPFSFTIAPSPTPVISGTLPNGNVDVPYSGTLTVTGGVAPFTWNITGLPATLTFASSGNTVTISGTPLVAATITGTATVTDSNSTSSAPFPFTFTIGPTPALAITPASLPQFMVGTALTGQVLTVSPATVGPYTWTITAGASLPPGFAFSGGTSTNPAVIMTTTTNTVTISGTPTTVGTFHVQITVTDSATPPNSTFVNYPIAVVNSNANACPAGSNNAGLPAGTTYAFLLKGFDNTPAPLVIAGSFTVDGNGGITAGDVDFNGFTNGPQEAGTSLDTADSSYSFDLNNDTRGCLSLVFNTGAAAIRATNRKAQGNAARSASSKSRRAIKREGIAPPPPPIPSRIVFQFALAGQTAGIYTTGNIIEFDNVDGNGTSASGVMHVQDTTAFNVTALAPNFAFGLSGWDINVDRAAMAGSFTNASGTLGPVFADFNDAGSLSGEITGGSGVINTVSTTTGRATASFTVPGVLSAVDAVIYVLNGNDFYVLLDDAVGASVPLLSGRALATSNTFAAGALEGFCVFSSEGLDPNTFTNVVSIGTAQFSSTGTTATASFTQSDAGTVTTPAFTGTYTVDTTNPSSGRVSFTVTSGTDTTPPVIYLTSGGDGIEQIQGFSVGQDTATSPILPNVVSGILVNQSATVPAFTAASVSGAYAFGSWEDVDGQNGAFSGSAPFPAPTTYSAVQDETFVTLNPPFLTPGASVPGTFTIQI